MCIVQWRCRRISCHHLAVSCRQTVSSISLDNMVSSRSLTTYFFSSFCPVCDLHVLLMLIIALIVVLTVLLLEGKFFILKILYFYKIYKIFKYYIFIFLYWKLVFIICLCNSCYIVIKALIFWSIAGWTSIYWDYYAVIIKPIEPMTVNCLRFYLCVWQHHHACLRLRLRCLIWMATGTWSMKSLQRCDML